MEYIYVRDMEEFAGFRLGKLLNAISRAQGDVLNRFWMIKRLKKMGTVEPWLRELQGRPRTLPGTGLETIQIIF